MFYKFPHTPHLTWLARTPCRDDKVLTKDEASEFLAGEITIEEKVDGANIGFSVNDRGVLQVQNRGHILARGEHPQFQPLWPWIDSRRADITDSLRSDLMLFGEWCFARHSIRYDRLPDWFLGFDIYDRIANRFWSSDRRDKWLNELGLSKVPRLGRVRVSIDRILDYIGPSRLHSGAMEGVYLRRENVEWLEQRAKIVRAEFAEEINRHWSEGALQRNAIRQ